ncbi:MAG: glycerate kinase [Planctomycetaceae bacterium]|nr:glycerate kinase [Planctomycetaceae bacterium]
MKIIIALDSFKSSLTAVEACETVSDAIVSEYQAVKTVLKPMADGGEGTAKAMLAARGGRWIEKKVTGPLANMEVDAGFAWFDKQKEALVEMATASGIELLTPQQLNPLLATTFGTGQLIKAAAEFGAQKILLAVGGSATVDCGIGAAMALGWEFLDSNNESVGFGGKALQQVRKIIKPQSLKLPPIEVLCDVKNPLCGNNGAARIFGPQKGATPEMVEELERGMLNIANIIKKATDTDIKNIPGTGAAGGLAAGAMAFMNAKLVSGVDTIIKEIQLEKEMADADWIITGEGCFDHQSLKGKVVSGIMNIAKSTKTKIAVIAGSVLLKKNEYQKHGIETAIGCRKDGMTLEYAITNGRKLLEAASLEFAKKNL